MCGPWRWPRKTLRRYTRVRTGADSTAPPMKAQPGFRFLSRQRRLGASLRKDRSPGCSKRLSVSPTHPRRSFPPTPPPSASHSIARDAPFRGAAAASTRFSTAPHALRFTPHEFGSDVRTLSGLRHVSTCRSWAGETSYFFSSLLVSTLRLCSAPLVAAAILEHSIRQGLPLVGRHQFLHLEPQAQNPRRGPHALIVCVIKDFRELFRRRRITGIERVELAMIQALLFAAGLQLRNNLTDNGLDLVRLVLILHGPVDQRLHLLLAPLPIALALAGFHHPRVVIGRTAAERQQTCQRKCRPLPLSHTCYLPCADCGEMISPLSPRINIPYHWFPHDAQS